MDRTFNPDLNSRLVQFYHTEAMKLIYFNNFLYFKLSKSVTILINMNLSALYIMSQ